MFGQGCHAQSLLPSTKSPSFPSFVIGCEQRPSTAYCTFPGGVSYIMNIHHDVFRVEVKPGHLSVKRVEEGHPLGDVCRELEGPGRVDDDAALAVVLVKHLVERPDGDKLGDHY